jgi:hypothetical protein
MAYSMPPPSASLILASASTTRLICRPLVFWLSSPSTSPTTAPGITNQFSHPRRGIKPTSAMISATMPRMVKGHSCLPPRNEFGGCAVLHSAGVAITRAVCGYVAKQLRHQLRTAVCASAAYAGVTSALCMTPGVAWLTSQPQLHPLDVHIVLAYLHVSGINGDRGETCLQIERPGLLVPDGYR